MMKRYMLWLTISAISAFTTASIVAQPDRCCSYSVEHKFKLCLDCPIQRIQWTWGDYANAWSYLGTNTATNVNTAVYSIPSSDTQCATASSGSNNHTCAVATACASFQVDWIPGTRCIQGSHTAYGRACAYCRLSGANATSFSSITVECGQQSNGFVQWYPAFQDAVRGGCEVEMRDPVIATWRNPATGDTRQETLFDLQTQGFNWEPQDLDGDGYPDQATLSPSGNSGQIYIVTQDLDADGYDDDFRVRFENNIVTEVRATGIFSTLHLPQPSEPIGPIDIFPSFDLQVFDPNGWELDSLQMGGDGDSGWRPEDVDGSGCVDDADLLAVLFDFGNIGDRPTDINRDGVVDDADLLAVLFAFGQGC